MIKIINTNFEKYNYLIKIEYYYYIEGLKNLLF